MQRKTHFQELHQKLHSRMKLRMEENQIHPKRMLKAAML